MIGTFWIVMVVQVLPSTEEKAVTVSDALRYAMQNYTHFKEVELESHPPR